ncbi:M20 aminoacylase family protein [Celerinatantimonas diazotrophica]|uniref:Hippurate hydrolase n=1 Tax=Celerinatantimonas diazotrophica TaxID=412034 RepID=A0A4R1K2A1_9GAMM|nr:M20 aminoacylase family protein [Celerinatantimonas diazotrophica]TCK57813.1 hippurate hydrolase [Celerinatantimonas diazotrophica]CAG9298123.1 Hippurate hydrolase [Celerinatantimonas diazotrophica]
MNRQNILPSIAAIRDEMVTLRREIHTYPEISFEEHRTSDLVARLLESWGYEVHRALAKTGVVGTLKKGDGQRIIALRADMDALPINEKTGLEYASLNHGTMHACGHDGHTASLLASAKALAQEHDFNGTLRVIFQPAEEGIGGGGADMMIREGLFEKFPCDAVYGFHNMPGYPAGQLGFYPGALMASADTVFVTFSGQGGHGAMPHKTADPIVAASSFVMALQSIVARNVDPFEPAVISVGRFHSGDISNVIPGEAKLDLTVRAMSPEVRQLLNQRIEAIAREHAQMYGLQVEISFEEPYPVLINTPEQTEFARQVAQDWVGEEGIIADLKPIMSSEDFAYMLEKVPGCYLIVGNDGPDNPNRSLHHPQYNFNDDLLPIVASYWVKLVEAYLR